jgi:hypothetical protein
MLCSPMPNRRVRSIEIDGVIARIPLTQGYVAEIDATDVRLVAGRNWRACVRPSGVYVVWTGPDGEDRFLHREIIEPPPELVVDHIDGNPLNNRRSNLRACSHKDNIRNSRRRAYNALAAKGVFAREGRFVGRIEADGREFHLGTYDTLAEARAAYFGAARVLFGDFANNGR